MIKLQRIKATAANWRKQIEELENPKQWEPTVDLDWVDRAHISTYTLLLKYVKEFGGDWVADWSDNKHYNYCVYYAPYRNIWVVKMYSTSCIGGAVYMSKDCALGLVAKLNSGEVVL